MNRTQNNLIFLNMPGIPEPALQLLLRHSLCQRIAFVVFLKQLNQAVRHHLEFGCRQNRAVLQLYQFARFDASFDFPISGFRKHAQLLQQQFFGIELVPAGLQHKNIRNVSALQRPESFQHVLPVPLVLLRHRVQNLSAADGDNR